MSSEKRLVLFMVLTFFSFLAIQFVMEKTGLVPPPKPQAKAQPKPERKPEGGKAAIAAKPGPAEAVADKGKAKAKGEGGAKPPEAKAKPEVAVAKPSELILGSGHDKTPGGYRLEVRLEQNGAGVDSVASSRYDADKEGRRLPKVPLDLLRHDPGALPSLALSLQKPGGDRAAAEPAEDGIVTIPDAGDIPLGEVLWEVVHDSQGRAVRPVTKVDPATKAKVEGQEVLFRTVVDELKVTLTKRYRLWKGEDGFDLDLGFESPEKERSLVYRLYGPHGIPIEGEWYTGTFRDVFFGQVRGKTTEIVTKPASEIAKPKAARFDNTALPLAFAGIENQYFAVFVEPVPTPADDEQRWDRETFATVVDMKPDAPQKADLSFEIVSKPVKVGPNHPVTQTYRVYAGPKTRDALAPFGAAELASYRKYQWFGIPGAAWMSMKVIAPLLDHIYNFTAWVARLFGAKSGNYGVAIILLTLLVRMIMFPLGRKQALAAKKMQDLQPLMKELQEKYKDDKERQTRETLGLYKKHGVNPVGGCLPALIQLPIFVGLWQALNNSVHLRHASFLFIKNLAAPDMLFRFPTQLPFLGDYFNILPFLVVSLMLVQTKLFAPPATTPEAEMQQKMMKYMMVFMGFMFYKVPSGLGIYFITSSTWQICERLLLPKVTHVPQSGDDVGDEKSPPGGGGRGGNNPPGGGGRGGNGPAGGRGGNGAPPKPQGKLAQFWERVKEEAAKDSTYRNLMDEREKKEKDKEKGKPRTRPGRRR